MKQVIVGLAMAAAMIAAVPASAALYFFETGGFSEGATFSGYFVGEDADHDGQIVSFNGEVSDFFGAFSGNSLVDPVSFGVSDLTGLVWNLDPILGDEDDGLDEGLRADSSLAIFGVGPGPVALCTGSQVCAVIRNVSDSRIFDTSVQGMHVIPAPVPEPASWALMIAGFALAGTGLRQGWRGQRRVTAG